jgi:hypothetical protein
MPDLPQVGWSEQGQQQQQASAKPVQAVAQDPERRPVGGEHVTEAES